MCDPVSASIALATATSALKVGAQLQQNGEAKRAFNLQNAQTNLGLTQSQAANSLKIQQNQTDMLKAASTAAASAGENGTAGNSVDALINDYHASESRFRNSLETQNQWDTVQADAQKQGQKINAQSKMVSPTAAYLGAALHIGAAGLDSYNQTQANTPNNIRR
jgi:hypothetical protein